MRHCALTSKRCEGELLVCEGELLVCVRNLLDREHELLVCVHNLLVLVAECVILLVEFRAFLSLRVPLVFRDLPQQATYRIWTEE